MPASLAGSAHPEFLVETDWLEAHLGRSELRVIDCTVHIVFDPKAMYTVTSGREDFARGHIPGAQFVDVVSELSDTSIPLPCMAPSAAQFTSVISALGVGKGSRVVLYAAQNAYWATRVWWLFRTFGLDNAAVLNGGWQKWRREGRPTEFGPARRRRRARLMVGEQRSLMVDKAEVLTAIGDADVCTINALPEDQHLFTSGVHYGRPGHIKGSISVPSEELLNPDTNEFLPAAELRQRFERAGAFNKRVITYCGGGVAASADAMALVMLGHPNVKLYDGSLCEWAADPSLPMEADPITTSSDQAIAAIESKRLLTELRDALDRQTATAEILAVINRSPGNLAPVFEAILDSALRLCEAAFGVFWTFDGRHFHAVGLRGVPNDLAEFLTRAPYEAHPDASHGRVLAGEALVHIADVSGEALYRSGADPTSQALVDLGGARTLLGLPLRTERKLLGFLTLHRREVRLFSDKHIVLLKSFADQAVIAIENARLITETREALDQQTATAEVLQVINSSPGNLAPVFDAMLEKALHLCEAASGILWSFDDERARVRASRDVPNEFTDYVKREPPGAGPDTFFGRAILTRSFVTSADISAEEPYRKGVGLPAAAVNLGGIRAVLMAPLVKDNTVPGVFSIFRKEVQPFTDRQIALLQSFAAQAVIAMENARLMTETRDALEQQTATAEVLQVINTSPGDLAPVFDALLDKGVRLCEASFGLLMTYDGEFFHTVALHSVPAAYAEFLREPLKPAPQNGLGRLLNGERLIHITDITADDAYRLGDPLRVATADLGGSRTHLVVPLLKDDALLGAIVAYRREVRPFSDKQIALLQNFAAQAVIAMENARLITETREALEQQTATAEVLQVINSSPGDLAPVFDAMLEKALYLCSAAFGVLWTYDGEFTHAAAIRGATAEYREFLSAPHRPGPGSAQLRLIQGERFVHVADLADSDDYRSGDALPRALVDLGGGRSLLALPLRKDGAYVGAIMIYRQQPNPFSNREITLLENFAAQAVIAMENARLITETREALDQQTATSEVLQVINSSPGDLVPVFDAMLEKATVLCEAEIGTLWTYDGEWMHASASRGAPPAFAEFLQQKPTHPLGGLQRRLLGGERFVQTDDLAATEGYRSGTPLNRAAVDLGGVRTLLTVPLRKDETVPGNFGIYRQEVRPFSEKQIALLENFAAQAVIAMENARLITETREALEQQTATAEVLQVINSSPGDLAPVFDAILEKAHSLCGATRGTLFLFDGEMFRAAATHGYPDELAERLRQGINPRSDTTAFSPLLVGDRLVHHPDLREVDDPLARAVSGPGGVRTNLLLPLRRERTLLGMISCNRHEVKPFSDREIALLENFAAQAVIAMENARLITETREALEQQTATAEVLGVINSSLGDLAPVFDAILEKAHTLCSAAHGSLQFYDGENLHAVATKGVSSAFADILRQGYRAAASPASRELIAGSRFTHILDCTQVDHPVFRNAAELAGIRTVLFVPLRKDDAFLGLISAARLEISPFTDKQIALLQNFAVQAVIAMENARLLGELQQRTGDLQESLEYQTATSDVLKVISQSTFDLEPVLQTVLDTAMRLCGNIQGSIFRLGEDGLYRQAVGSGMQPEYYEIEAQQEIRPGSATLVGRTAAAARPIQITDAWTDPDYAPKEDARVGQLRSMLGVPLLREGTPIGVICTARTIVKPFTEKEIELVATFADQAVIAIENARLLGELRQREAELRVTFDNMADGVAMFDQALHLAAWNRNFQELLQLPDGLLAERLGFDDYIRYLAERGEFGETDPEAEIARLHARLSEHYSFERSRPDGAIIEVRHNPMPEGGLVLIYGDITERKRSEAEIRAARDVAEATLRDLKAAQANLIQAEKMASLGQLTAGIAHEIKNPLNFVNNFASLSVELLDELKETTAPAVATLDEKRRAEVDEVIGLLGGNLEKIADHGRRADNIVKSMLEHSRGVSGERREVDLNGLIEEALNLAYHGARAQDASFNITLERELDRNLAGIELAPQEMTRVFLNLFGNGFYAATKRQRDGVGTDFRPTLTVATRELGNGVEVRIRDNGTGIPPEIRDKLFQPFFTTKPTGEGTGLGLSISYDIVTQQHGGSIEVDSEVEAFTEFTIRLPRRGQAAAQGRSA